MPAKDRAWRDELTAANNVGVVAAVCELQRRGKPVELIAALLDDIYKACGNAAIRASGVNGDPKVDDIENHMKDFGVSLAERIA